MDVAQPINIPPPSYHEVAPAVGRSLASAGVSQLGPPPPYSSQEELWTALQQTDADGLSSTSFELPPSYEEAIAGLSAETGEADPILPTPTAPPSDQPRTRHSWHGVLSSRSPRQQIHICKPNSSTNRGYGFAFRDGRVTVVLPNSAAMQAGLTEGCRLVEVNGINVEGQNKDIICQQIKQNAEGVLLLVEPPGNLVNMTCHSLTLNKPPQGYGFAFRGIHVSVVLPSSVAAVAGLQVGDTLLKINGFSTAGRDRSSLLELINQHQDRVNVVVTRRGAPQHHYQPTMFQLRRSPFTGFGFAFRGTRVSALLPGSEAERTGLRIGDRVLEINGSSTQGLDKNAMLRLINARSDVVSLLVQPDASPIHTGR